MATLSGNKIKDTYQSLVKFSDNGNITVGAKQLTDGFGNNSPMFVSTTQVGIGVTPEAGLNLHVFGDAKIGSNLTVIGNLVVEGSTTTVGTDTLTVKDPLIVLANNNTSTDAVDIGFYGKYTPSGTTLYSGLFREALTGKYRLFKGLEVEPTTTVNTSGTGYAIASLVANLEGNVTGNITGNVTGNLTGNVTGDVTGDLTGDVTGNVTGNLTGNVTGNVTGDLTGDVTGDITGNVTGNVAGNLTGNVTGDVTGNVTGDLTGNVTATSVLADGVTATTQSSGDNSTKVATTAYVDSLQISSTLSEILANGNTSGANDIIMADGQKVNYGDDSDLEIYHDGTDGYVQNGTGNLIIEQTTDDGDIIFKNDNGSGDTVEYFRVDGSESRVVYGRSIQMADNVSVYFGNSVDDDGYIKWDSTADELFINGDTKFLEDARVVGQLAVGEKIGNSQVLTVKGASTANLPFVQLVNTATSSHNGLLVTCSNAPVNYLADFRIGSTSKFKINASGSVISTGSIQAVTLYGDDVGINDTISGNFTTNYDTKLLVGGEIIARSLTANASMISIGGDATSAFIKVGKQDGSLTARPLRIEVGTTEAMNIDSSGNVGIGVDPSFPLHIKSSTDIVQFESTTNGLYNQYKSTDGIIGYVGSGSQTVSGGATTDFGIQSPLGSLIIATGGNTERMRIDSLGNVGINRTSIAQPSSGATTLAIQGTSTTKGGSIRLYSSDDSVAAYIYPDNTNGLSINTSTSHPMVFRTAATERMRITSGGNVGIGETSPLVPLHISKDSASGENIALLLDNNNTTAGNEIGILFRSMAGSTNTDFEIFGKANGANDMDLVFQSDGSVERMRILGDGSQTQIKGKHGGGADLLLYNTDVTLSTDQMIGRLGFYKTDGSGSNVGVSSSIQVRATNSGSGSYMSFHTDGETPATQEAERMRITSGGNVGIGTTSPQSLLSLGDAVDAQKLLLYDDNNNFKYGFGIQSNELRQFFPDSATARMVFGTISDSDGSTFSEKMRITSDGNVGIGTTTPAHGKLVISSLQNNSNNFTWLLFDNQAAGYGDWNMFKSGNNDLAFGYGTSNGASFTNALTLKYGGDLHVKGDVVAYSTTISDKRLKDDVKPLESSLDKVMNLKGVEYVWNNGSRKGQKDIGFIAQEVEEIIPEIVREKEVIFDKEEKYKTVDYEKITAVLVEAVKELTAKVERLENKCK